MMWISLFEDKSRSFDIFAKNPVFTSRSLGPTIHSAGLRKLDDVDFFVCSFVHLGFELW